MKPFALLNLFVCPFLFSACLVTYGDNISRSYATLQPNTLPATPPNRGVPLFYEGEKVDFHYDKMGWVTVEGAQGNSQRELQDHLKFEAYKNGANALVLVKSSYKTRESGTLFSKTPPQKYDALVLTGLAIRVDSLTYTTIAPEDSDTGFVKTATRDDTRAGNRTAGQLVGSALLSVTCVVLTAYLALTR